MLVTLTGERGGNGALIEMKGKSLKVFLTTVEEGYRPQLQRLNTQIAFK